jgi:hypothetical protein
MSLAPESRSLLTDALRPPAGYRLDAAVATTYSADLVALLMAPLSFALRDDAATAESPDPIAVLEAARRYAEKITVFCQGGGIYPAAYQSVLTFIEDSIVEVTAPRDGTLFHPKVWALRFVDPTGGTRHRCLVLSRNLTFDQSWDTVLTLDEADSEGHVATIDGAPLGRFIHDLPSLTNTPLERSRLAQVADLATSIGSTRFALPGPYHRGEILPLGMAWSEPLTIAPGRRLLAVSPFVARPVLASLRSQADDVILLSRPAALDKLGNVVEKAYVLADAAEREVDDQDAVDADTDGADVVTSPPDVEPDHDLVPASEATPPPVGLHAKIFLSERGDEVELVTGSANATGSGFDGNVELVVRLHGRRANAGIDTVWEGNGEAPGMSAVVTPYTPQPLDPDVEQAESFAWTIDGWHAELSRAGLQLHVTDVDAGTARVSLIVGTDNGPPEGCQTTVRPMSLHERVGDRELDDALHWGPISLRNVTPFVVVTTSAGQGRAQVTRSRALRATLVGDVPERRQNALRDIIRNSDDLLRYLVFLLGDPAMTMAAAHSALGRGRWGAASSPGTWNDIAIFEPLMRAVARGDDAVERIGSLIEELGEDVGRDGLAPPELLALWDVVEQVREKKQ